MLGSTAEAEDAVQETWLRTARADVSGVENLRGWLTTVISRVCLDQLRSRQARREDSLDARVSDAQVPDPLVTRLPAGAGPATDPELAAEQADDVSLALLVVLQSLPPRERMAFVLHDLFGVPFETIGSIVDRSPGAAMQLASRARRRVRAAPPATRDLPTQRRVLDAFLAASREGDFDALLAVLDPDVTLRADLGADGGSIVVRGAATVAGRALMFSRLAQTATAVLVNGCVGLVSFVDGRPVSVFSPVVRGGRIVEINVVADPERLARLDLGDVL